MSISELLEPLLQPLQLYLEEHPDGVTEFALLRALEQGEVGCHDNGAGATDVFRQAKMADSYDLFIRHFLLFHALYLLSDRLRHDGCSVSVNCLSIRILSNCATISTGREDDRAASQYVTAADPMRSYYLNEENLHSTSREDVEKMLRSFWRGFSGRGDRSAALATLGLGPEADSAAIERRYRQLAFERHPDQGGCEESFRELQRAVEILRS